MRALKVALFGALWLFLVLPASAYADETAEVLARLPCVPSVEATLAAAARALGEDTSRSAASRARLAGLLPQVELRGSWRGETLEEERFREDLYYDPAAAALRQDGTQNQGRGQAQTGREVSVRLRFELGRLVYDPQELQAAREARAWRQERAKLFEEVTRRYYARRGYQAALLMAGPGQLERRLELMVAIEREGAMLDALTGGWFTRQEEAR
jgi:hypothetical protein